MMNTITTITNRKVCHWNDFTGKIIKTRKNSRKIISFKCLKHSKVTYFLRRKILRRLLETYWDRKKPNLMSIGFSFGSSCLKLCAIHTRRSYLPDTYFLPRIPIFETEFIANAVLSNTIAQGRKSRRPSSREDFQVYLNKWFQLKAMGATCSGTITQVHSSQIKHNLCRTQSCNVPHWTC